VAALKALEQAHSEAEQDRAAMRAAMVAGRVRLASSRLVLVDRWDELRAGALLLAAVTAWRGAVMAGRAEAGRRRVSEVEGELAGLREICTRRRAAVPSVVGRLLGMEEVQLAVSTLRGWKLWVNSQASSRSGKQMPGPGFRQGCLFRAVL